MYSLPSADDGSNGDPNDLEQRLRGKALQDQLVGNPGVTPIPGGTDGSVLTGPVDNVDYAPTVPIDAPVGNSGPSAPSTPTTPTTPEPYVPWGGWEAQPELYTGAAKGYSNGTNATYTTVQTAFQNAIQNLLNGPSPQQAGQDVLNSPAVKAHNLVADKQAEKDRAFLAERAAAGGYSGSGGFNSGVIGLRQKAGEDKAAYAGDQAAQEEQGRRQELLTALSMAQQLGDRETTRALQVQLAQMQQGTAADQLAAQIADRQAYYNQLALQNIFGGF